jgi:hypothetical protein
MGLSATVQVEAVGKASGVRALIEPAQVDLKLLAAGDAGVLVSHTADLHEAFVLESGDGRSRTAIGSQRVGIVRAASGRPDQPAAPVGLVSCPAGAPGYCAAGALTQFTLAGSGTTLGANAAASAVLSTEAISGLVSPLAGQTVLSSPAGFGDGETDTRDAWQFTAGGASSLTRVTNNLP